MEDKFTYRHISREEVNEAEKLVLEFLGESDVPEFRITFLENPQLVVGCFNNQNEVIGICFGLPTNKEVIILKGIVIHWDYKAKGLGSSLLHYFEEKVKENLYQTISLGSADGYVESFYLKNGYSPVSYLVTTNNINLEDFKRPEVTEIRNNLNSTTLTIKNDDGYVPKNKELLKKRFSASQVIYIFEKNLQ